MNVTSLVMCITIYIQKLLSKFASMCGATVCKDFNPNVTHIITSTNGSGACGRTLKFLLGILSGKWILKIDCKSIFY